MNRRNTHGLLTSGELGAAAAVSADTIRHYERMGLLPKPMRTEGGYRLYPAESLIRVYTVRAALKAGFTLAELAGVFKERAAGGVPCQRVADLASEKLGALERQIAELTGLRDLLSATLDTWTRRLDRTPAGRLAGLLESLAGQQLSAHPNDESKGKPDESAHALFNSRPGLRNSRPRPNGLSHDAPTAPARDR